MFSIITALLKLFLLMATSTFAAPTPSPLNSPAPFDFISLTAAGKLSTPGTSQLTKRNIGGVRMSDGADFTGTVWYGIYPLNTCIDLRDYAGHVLSFRPDEGTECLLMQGRCDGNDEFADLFHNSTNIGNLGEYFWIGNVRSYICIEK